MPAIHEHDESDERAPAAGESASHDDRQQDVIVRTPLSSGACQFVPTSAPTEATPPRKGSAYDDIFGSKETATVGQGPPRHPPGLGPISTITGAASSSFSASSSSTPATAATPSTLTSTCYKCFSLAVGTCSICVRSFCICHGFKGHLMVMCSSCLEVSTARQQHQHQQLEAQSPGTSSLQQTTPSSDETATSWMLIPRPDESQSQEEPEEFTALPASGNPFKNLAVINGVCVIGLIVDPGAARGLIGSATLREIFEKLLRPRGLMKHVMWYRSKNKFTGISSQPQHSIGICVFPIGLVGMKNAYFSCDVITGQSANCPGLIPLQTLLRLGSVISCGHFQNQDGLLGLRLSNGEMCPQRILCEHISPLLSLSPRSPS